MKILFIGAVEFSNSVLNHLIKMQANIVGVCTLAQSSFNADHIDLSLTCRVHQIACRYTPDINSPEVIAWIKELMPDVIFCFGWSKLLKTELLNLPPLGVVGFHPSALPFNRGRHPIIWALALGLSETASSFFFMDEGADTGDILSQERVKISAQDNAQTLYEKITKTALKQISNFVPQLASNQFSRIPQLSSKANTWRKRGKFDGLIDWRMSAKSIHNLVRALTKPYVGAHFLYQGNEIKLWSADIIDADLWNLEPGKIISVEPSAFIVKCGENAIRLTDYFPSISPQVGEYL